MMKCLWSGEQLKAEQMARPSVSQSAKDCSASGYSSQTLGCEQKIDIGNIEEAETTLREGICLNFEEARALLGRLEYQRGNTEAALRVFDGIDIAAIVPKMKITLAKRVERRKFRSQWDAPPMSMHAVSLLVEAMYLKARALQDLGKFKEAAQSCSIILDTVESALPRGVPESFGTDCKLQETLCKAIELIPELWKQSGCSHEAFVSYRRALLRHWNLDSGTISKIQKEFAIYLLYGGCEASPPNLRSQMDSSFIPRNNIEEAILLLMILLRKFALNMVEWDPSIINHLTFALSVSGHLRALANQVEELLPGVLERKERYYTLALCYLGDDDHLTALNLLRKLLNAREDPNCVKALLLASKICGDTNSYPEEGVLYARKTLDNLHDGCDRMGGVANFLLGTCLSAQARSSTSESERVSTQCEALEALERAEKMMHGDDYRFIFALSLENAEQRKMDVALRYANRLPKLDAGASVKGWILLARILSAQKKYVDAEIIVNAAMDQTGTWDQGELLRTKAKIQIARGQLKNAVETYIQLLAIIQLRNKTFCTGMKNSKDNVLSRHLCMQLSYLPGGANAGRCTKEIMVAGWTQRGGDGKQMTRGYKYDRSLEIETWHDLANIYTSMSQWRDSDVCLYKLKAISPYSALGWHATGRLLEARGLKREALGVYAKALDIDPAHVPSLVSTACILRKLGERVSVVRSFLTDALRLDRTNFIAWFNLGLLYKDEGGVSALEAVECFQAAALLEESAPVEPFR